MAKPYFSAEYLRSVLHYDPETGVFTRLVRLAHRVQIGDVAGCISHGYMRIGILGVQYYAHILAFIYMTGTRPRGEIDHLNGTRSDNRWSNLRDVPPVINKQNVRFARSNNKSCGLLGVTRDKKQWRASIKVEKRLMHLGTFDTPEAAHDAYLKAKRTLHLGCTI